MHAISAVSKANDLVDRQRGWYSREFDSIATDIYGDRFLGKHRTRPVGAENAHRNLNFFSGFAAFSHPFSDSLLRALEEVTGKLGQL